MTVILEEKGIKKHYCGQTTFLYIEYNTSEHTVTDKTLNFEVKTLTATHFRSHP